MDLQNFFKNKSVIRTGLLAARAAPRWAGYGLAERVGKMIERQKPAVYWQLRENISHIPGTDDEPGKLDSLTRQAFINAGRYYYDFYNSIGLPPEAIREKVDVPYVVFEEIEKARSAGRGIQLSGIHLSNFDLGSISLAAHGLTIHGLSAANPNEAYEFQNEIRKKYGFIATPIDASTLRSAIKRLKDGGIVAGAIDWPHPEEPTVTEVFGKPAYVPLGTAKLALLTNAVTLILAFYEESPGCYKMHVSKPLDPIRTGKKQEDILANTRAYMRVFETFVSQYPAQWMMFHKFWANGAPEEKEP